jgi:hypothetical protein
VKPTPLSAVLADDLLLDQVRARVDTDDELGSLLLAVAHRVDSPLPRIPMARRARRHRGLTVLAALGVAVSGATVAAAVELAPASSDSASGAPHSRVHVPPALQGLALPFRSSTPFQGRLVPTSAGGMPAVTAPGTSTAGGLPATLLPEGGPLGLPVLAASAAHDAQLDQQDQSDATKRKGLAKGAQNGATEGGQTPAEGSTAEDAQGNQTESAPEPAQSPSHPTSGPSTGNGQANGQANAGGGQAHANGRGQGASGWSSGSGGSATGGTGSGAEGTGTTTDGSSGTTDGTDTTGGTSADDADQQSGTPAKGKAATGTTGAAHASTAKPAAGTTGTTTPGSTNPRTTPVTPNPSGTASPTGTSGS